MWKNDGTHCEMLMYLVTLMMMFAFAIERAFVCMESGRISDFGHGRAVCGLSPCGASTVRRSYSADIASRELLLSCPT